MNKPPFESKNEIFTNNDLIPKNNILEINDKSGISFNFFYLKIFIFK